MGPDILIPVLLIAVVVPVVFAWARSNLKNPSGGELDVPVDAPSARLTSAELRNLATPPWRVVYEIGHDKLDGVQHVLIGQAGVFALQTSLEPMPTTPPDTADPHEIARAAIARSGLDDALARCAMSSHGLVTVHWGVVEGDFDVAVDMVPGLTAVDGRRLTTWADSLAGEALTPAQVDLAWQTVVTAIGRPDPLA